MVFRCVGNRVCKFFERSVITSQGSHKPAMLVRELYAFGWYLWPLKRAKLLPCICLASAHTMPGFCLFRLTVSFFVRTSRKHQQGIEEADMNLVQVECAVEAICTSICTSVTVWAVVVLQLPPCDLNSCTSVFSSVSNVKLHRTVALQLVMAFSRPSNHNAHTKKCLLRLIEITSAMAGSFDVGECLS